MQPGAEVSPNVLVLETPYFIRNKQTNQLAFPNPLRYCGPDPNPPNLPRFNFAPDGQILCGALNPNEYIFLEAVQAVNPPNPAGGGRRKRRGSKKTKKSRSRKGRR